MKSPLFCMDVLPLSLVFSFLLVALPVTMKTMVPTTSFSLTKRSKTGPGWDWERLGSDNGLLLFYPVDWNLHEKLHLLGGKGVVLDW
jgi:hypothetical protein